MKTWNLAFVAVVAIFGIAVLNTGCASAPAPEPEQVISNPKDLDFKDGISYKGTKIGSANDLDTNGEYTKLLGRLSVGGPFTFYVISQNDRWNPYRIVKIDGLMTVAEFDAYVTAEAERRAEYRGGMLGGVYNYYYVVDWSKAFPIKEEAKTWLAKTINDYNAVVDVIGARNKLYEDDVKGFKLIPSKATLDVITRDKNNLIEAWNRLRPIASEIAQVAAKGVTFQKSRGERSGLPNYENWSFGLTEQQISNSIERINNDYAKLVDTYPVN